MVRKVSDPKIQTDEMWGFLYAKDKTLELGRAKSPPKEAGTVWTWTAIEQYTKLIISWNVSPRRGYIPALEFMKDVRSRVEGRVELSTDGLKTYEYAVFDVFGHDVDYGQVVKYYVGGNGHQHPRYTHSVKTVIAGNPKHITTSHVERQNQTMRTHMRRYTRRGTTHSKTIQNHCHALALYFAWYNSCRPYMNLGVFTTPAMAAGLAEEQHSLQWLVTLADGLADYPVWEPEEEVLPYGTRKPDEHLAERLPHYDGQVKRRRRGRWEMSEVYKQPL